VTALPLAFEVKWDSFVQYYRFNMEAFVIDIRFIHGKMFIITASPLAVDVIAILFSFVTRDIYEEKFFLAVIYGGKDIYRYLKFCDSSLIVILFSVTLFVTVYFYKNSLISYKNGCFSYKNRLKWYQYRV